MRLNHTSSRRQVFFFLLIILASVGTASLAPRLAGARRQQRQQGAVDWILVLDTSASMRGAGGSRDIFDRVKTSMAQFINSARPGDSVTIFTFDRDTVAHPTVRIADENDERDLINTLAGIKANGDRTHTGLAIHEALRRAGELKQRAEASHRVGSIVLFTDGIEDVRGIANPVGIPSNVALVSKSQPYIFFISLGQEHDQQLEDFIRSPELGGRGEVVRDPGAENIEGLADRIRIPIEAAAAVPTPTPTPTPLQVIITVEPASLDFGAVEPGEQTGRRSLRITGNVAVPVQLELQGGEAAGLQLAEPAGPIALKPGEAVSVDVRLAVAPSAPDGARTLLLRVNPRDEAGQLPPDAVVKTAWAEARVTVAHVPLLSKLLKWLALGLALLILLVAGFLLYNLVYKGQGPGELWVNTIERNYLEGELEIVRPPPAQPEDGIIGLPALKVKRLSLSSLVPGGATAGSDAELSTAYKDGVKRVRLERTLGSVRVNNVEVAVADLYDGYLLELGDARLRFNWPGHEEPPPPDGAEL